MAEQRAVLESEPERQAQDARENRAAAWFGVFIVMPPTKDGQVRVGAHWLLSGVIRNSLNRSEVLVNHVAFAG